ncbi:helix-turn-helix domain-containing protein [Prevotella disiens]
MVFPCISLLFPCALKYDKHSLLLQAETCDKPQNKNRNYKQNNNRTMGYFIITDSNWAKLRNEILSLAETCHKAFGERSKHTDWLHNGDVCQLLNISKRTLQHYRDTGVLPFAQIGHKCYYKREDVERLLEIKSVKSNTDKSKDNK